MSEKVLLDKSNLNRTIAQKYALSHYNDPTIAQKYALLNYNEQLYHFIKNNYLFVLCYLFAELMRHI